MIRVDDVVADGELTAPQPFQILRSTGRYIPGGFESTTVTLQRLGPVQRATDREIRMLPENDRAGGIMAFWSTEPIYGTRAPKTALGTSGQSPVGTVPGTVYTLPDGVTSGTLYKNGLFQMPGVDYTLSGSVITMSQSTIVGDRLWFTFTTDVDAPSESDILVYPPNGSQYRVLGVRHYPGSGYWKALGTAMSQT